MGKLKGAREYERYCEGGKLTRKESMLAKCYECNGYEESAKDCKVEGCPMYPYHHYRG